MFNKPIVKMTQNLYDWIWDTKGLYKGHLVYLALLLSVGLCAINGDFSGFLTSRIFCVVLLVAFGFFMNYNQSRRNYAYMNAHAEACEKSPFIFLMRFLSWFFIFKYSVLVFDLFGLSFHTTYQLAFYLFCVKVRDRQKRESFQFSFNNT